MTTPNLASIRAAAERIALHAHRTPVLTSSYLDRRLAAHVYFKCENFQKVGAFKFRGALNAVLSLSDDEAARGVVTHSSGNHAQALALAARIRGIAATIVMPENCAASEAQRRGRLRGDDHSLPPHARSARADDGRSDAHYGRDSRPSL